MIIQHTLNLIQEIKAKHWALGAGAVGAGLAGAASMGLLGKDAEESMSAANNSISGIRPGYNVGQSLYDATTDSSQNNLLDRNLAGLKGAKEAASGIYNAQMDAYHLNDKAFDVARSGVRKLTESFDYKRASKNFAIGVGLGAGTGEIADRYATSEMDKVVNNVSHNKVVSKDNMRDMDDIESKYRAIKTAGRLGTFGYILADKPEDTWANKTIPVVAGSAAGILGQRIYRNHNPLNMG